MRARAQSRVTSHKESLHDETRYAAEAVNVDACGITHDYLLFLYVPPFLRRSHVYDGSLGWVSRNESAPFFLRRSLVRYIEAVARHALQPPAIPFKLLIAVTRR